MTTQEQYEKDLAAHNVFIERYRLYLDRIYKHMEWKKKGESFTADEMRRIMTAEIDMASSCDAPNKPGYERANND